MIFYPSGALGIEKAPKDKGVRKALKILNGQTASIDTHSSRNGVRVVSPDTSLSLIGILSENAAGASSLRQDAIDDLGIIAQASRESPLSVFAVDGLVKAINESEPGTGSTAAGNFAEHINGSGI